MSTPPNDGSCQWMTAGSGIVHQEMPQPAPHLLGLQIWLNLPANKKMAPPKYHSLDDKYMSVVERGGITLKIISGYYNCMAGSMQSDYVPVDYLDVELPPHAQWQWRTIAGNTVFAYILQGQCYFGPDDSQVDSQRAALFSDGEKLSVKAGEQGARLVLLSAKPLNQPIYWEGSMVMNTKEQMEQAMEDLKNGTFIK